MLYDQLLAFDPAGTAITAGGASTNVLDLSTGRDLGIDDGNTLSIFGLITTTLTAAGAATLQVSLQGAVDNAGVPGTWYDFVMTGVMPKANLTAGTEFLRVALPMAQPGMSGTTALPRFLRLNYTVGTGPFTAGVIQACLAPHDGRTAAPAYPSGFTAFN